jgi:hypothetical protein
MRQKQNKRGTVSGAQVRAAACCMMHWCCCGVVVLLSSTVSAPQHCAACQLYCQHQAQTLTSCCGVALHCCFRSARLRSVAAVPAASGTNNLHAVVGLLCTAAFALQDCVAWQLYLRHHSLTTYLLNPTTYLHCCCPHAPTGSQHQHCLSCFHAGSVSQC